MCSLEEISLSYNGGKDCLVLLILYIAALASHPSFAEPPASTAQASTNTSTTTLTSIPSVYIISAHPFPEVETFVSSTTVTYSLDLKRYAQDMKTAFEDYLQAQPKVKAIFVGTRRTDPHGGKLTHFDETDHGWPRFMRVHPVIDWCYVDIWTVCSTRRSFKS
jgi:FAD synthetase